MKLLVAAFDAQSGVVAGS